MSEKLRAWVMSFDGKEHYCPWCTARMEDGHSEDCYIAQLEAELAKYERLTPGGSEFHDSPENVYRFIEQSMHTVGKVAAKNKRLQAQVRYEIALKKVVIAQLEAELAEAQSEAKWADEYFQKWQKAKAQMKALREAAQEYLYAPLGTKRYEIARKKVVDALLKEGE